MLPVCVFQYYVLVLFYNWFVVACSSFYPAATVCFIVFIDFYAGLILQNKDCFVFRLLQILTAQILIVR